MPSVRTHAPSVDPQPTRRRIEAESPSPPAGPRVRGVCGGSKECWEREFRRTSIGSAMKVAFVLATVVSFLTLVAVPVAAPKCVSEAQLEMHHGNLPLGEPPSDRLRVRGQGEQHSLPHDPRSRWTGLGVLLAMHRRCHGGRLHLLRRDPAASEPLAGGKHVRSDLQAAGRHDLWHFHPLRGSVAWLPQDRSFRAWSAPWLGEDRPVRTHEGQGRPRRNQGPCELRLS